MIIVNTEFRDNVLAAIAEAGFNVPENKSHFNYIDHKTIEGFRIQYRELHGRIKIEISGHTIKVSRNIEYDESEPKAINNLKSRLKRLFVKEQDLADVRSKRFNRAVSRKLVMKEKINLIFNKDNYGHSVVIDEDSLNDEFGSLTVYYRSYEFNVNMNDKTGDIYSKQGLLNKPSGNMPLDKLVKVIDVLVS